ncbi:pyrroline-5-carboxylate reductase [Glacieibacterium frigidum]|uniref:Pyrroline-5-carboxylate reductase n=1 Tax=Glacieibacterium frigidum TaxID=2593303 RepID=A0A552U7G8_9SPHN|nr:pyrroline-5-carboxylate reductase [Glacieibacterium frigidum]TRW14162.1 pyrroline-5-carboxylate reductase [Glacieibacterium frigidum]
MITPRPLPDIGSVWLLGCGNMGGALLRRWVEAGLTRVAVIDPAPRSLPEGVAADATPPEGVPDVLVVAVKPQMLAEAAAPLIARLGPDTLIVSIVAGVSSATLSAMFGGRQVVRTMPNTPASAGQGVTALFGPRADGTADALFSAAGTTVWLDDEAQFDAVTAVSGSGPAYVFAMIEALAAAGVAAGLPQALADELALRTVAGAGHLAALGEASPAALRESVTSPNGTTAAGLAVLQPALGPLVTATVAAAARRSRELGEAV